ncbi:ATP-binding protein [Phenylobacterium sp.]|uniref:ATP-binding protein n=1 Tax=Phenylobacterium sp. TaxID=1871053 RepID=UPI00301BE9AA
MEAKRAGHDGPSKKWLALVSVVEQLSAAEDLQSIIGIVRDAARQVSGADGVTFVLRDGDQCHYVEENAIGPLWKGRRFPLTDCISGWCMLNREPAVIPDIYVDPRIPHDAYRPTFVKSLIMAPVRPAAPLGAIGSYWATERAFTPADLALVEGLARATTAAVEAVLARTQTRRNEARLRLALDAGRLGAWELDLSTLALDASTRCREILGWPGDAALDQGDLLRAIHPDDLLRSQRLFNEARAGRAPFQVEVRAAVQGPDVRGADVRWIELRGAAIRDAEDRVTRIAGVVSDVTEARRARDRIDELQASLRHAGRLSELGRMSAAIAHELGQPLTAAGNYLTAAALQAQRPDVSPDDILDLTGRAKAQVERAGQILRRIRGVAARGDTEPRLEDMGAMLGEVLELARLDPRHRETELRLAEADDAPATVRVDRTQILQVALNLVRNALEAVEDSPERRVDITVSASANDVVVRVADTGPGLAPEVREKLFEPFTTTKAEGLGIGLSISRGIMEAHGGRIWTEDGDGGVFCFSLPKARPT